MMTSITQALDIELRDVKEFEAALSKYGSQHNYEDNRRILERALELAKTSLQVSKVLAQLPDESSDILVRIGRVRLAKYKRSEEAA